MGIYRYSNIDIKKYLKKQYKKGLNHSIILSDTEIEQLLSKIGIFRFKGYLYAFREEISMHNIDDVFTLYYFDKFITRYVMDMTSTIETLLKSKTVELCYKWTDNPFFYLLKENHKYRNFKINKPTLDNWKNRKSVDGEEHEQYRHYCLYYKQKYIFSRNREFYLTTLGIDIEEEKINYPPFHYIIESATLGSLITFIKSIKIGKYDLLHGVSKDFGINPKLFKQYLDRLNEVRNRVAHRERVFNRGYRSVRAFGEYKKLRKNIEPHSFVDVYLYFYFMLGYTKKYKSFEEFFKKEIVILFKEYRQDRLISLDSMGLNKKLKDENYSKIVEFITIGMGIKKPTILKWCKIIKTL